MSVLNKGFVLSLVVSLSLIFSPMIDKAYAETSQTMCYPSTETLHLGTDFISQTFESPFDVITKIEFQGKNHGSQILLNMDLRASDGSVVESDSAFMDSQEEGGFYFWPNSSAKVNKTDTFTLWLSSNLNEDNSFYIWKGADSARDCIPSGTAFRNFTNLNHDLAMVIYGHDYESGEVVDSDSNSEPVGEAVGPQEDETTETEVTTSDQDTGSSTTDGDSTTAQQENSSSTEETGNEDVNQASNAPNDVAAEYSEESDVVSVSWSASTMENVDGYEIYRAESSERAFVKVAEVGAETYSYEDGDLEPGEYHYYVVATSEDKKSDTSDVASVKVEKDGSSTASGTSDNENKSTWQTIVDYIAGNIWTSMALGALAVALMGLLYYLIRKRKKKAEKK